MGETDAGRGIEALYGRCAAHRQRFQDAALRSVPLPKVMEQAYALGLPANNELAQVPEADVT